MPNYSGKVLLLLLFAVLYIAGCSQVEDRDEHQNQHQDELRHPYQYRYVKHDHAPNGDLQETTKSLQSMPAFLSGQNIGVRSTYKLAADNWEILKWIPCYCGCGKSAGHQSNMNCFIRKVKSDGTVIWDDHGTRCRTCLQIAQKSSELKRQGKSISEIRTAIEASYEAGYPDPTLTPLFDESI